MLRRACVTAVVCAATLALFEPSAHAYEFWLRAQTIGQAYQLRQYQLLGPDLFLGRRRYTQTLALRITDIGGLADYRRTSHLPAGGLVISWHSYLRVDHDYGQFTAGRIKLSDVTVRDAIDVIPELAEQSAALDLLYGYVSLDGLADHRLSLQLGRVLIDDGWGSSGLDGGTARYELPMAPIAVTAAAGLRVRAASPLGVSAYELDGTSGAGCQEYVEGPTPGSGTWKLIDRNRMVTNEKLTSDYEYCPQREMRQPSIGVALATARLRRFGAEIGYRRTWSDTVGLIDDANRFANPDLGLYPNEAGQAPASGINEERMYARAHGDVAAGAYTLSPYGDVRYSLLHAAIDRADLGVRVTRGKHVLEPSVEYFLPTFDGDSIFNVFSIEPTTDVRLGYQFNGVVKMRASAWLRRYSHEAELGGDYAGGGDAGIDHPFGARMRARLDALFDTGYGGRRAGGTSEFSARVRDDLWLSMRGAVLAVRPDDGKPAFVTVSGVASGSLQVTEGVGMHVVAELDHDDIYQLATRVFAVIDLAFMPEP